MSYRKVATLTLIVLNASKVEPGTTGHLMLHHSRTLAANARSVSRRRFEVEFVV